jgi:uncharacterized protein (TIGR00730 family)
LPRRLAGLSRIHPLLPKMCSRGEDSVLSPGVGAVHFFLCICRDASSLPSVISSICVYCGSSPGRQGAYVQAARALALALVGRGIHLVYGGAQVGVMGALADAVLAAGGRVTGVIPRALAQREIAHAGLTELIVTGSMHERKTIMAERAEAFIALPGGIGTLEELFEVWTWTQLGLQGKPCGLLNVAGYYDSLVEFIDHTVAEEYLKPSSREILSVASDPDVLLDKLSRYAAPVMEKWIVPGET